MIQPTLQDIAQDDGVVVLFVSCGEDERHRTLHRPLNRACRDLLGSRPAPGSGELRRATV